MQYYIRKNKKVSGPFPQGQIEQSLLLGRVSLNDEISQDKEEWLPIRRCPQVIPKVLLGDPKNNMARERLAAARRWADERRGERRDDADAARLGPGRRDVEDYGTQEYRYHREIVMHSLRKRREKVLGALVLVVLILAAGIYAGFNFIPDRPDSAACDVPAAANVNWAFCDLQGASFERADLRNARLNSANLINTRFFGSNLANVDLSYANLSQANLVQTNLQAANMKGANLRLADLSQADLSSADLSYANLTGATLVETQLDKARFDHAIWIDGRQCKTGSIGKCLTP